MRVASNTNTNQPTNTMKTTMKITEITDAHHNGACWEASPGQSWNVGDESLHWPYDRDAIIASITEADAAFVETEDGNRHLVRKN